MFFEVSLVFLLLNLNMFATWVWFSVADRRNLGYPHFQTEPNLLAEKLQRWIENTIIIIIKVF